MAVGLAASPPFPGVWLGTPEGQSVRPAPLRGLPTAELTRPLQRRPCVRPGLTAQTGGNVNGPADVAQATPGLAHWLQRRGLSCGAYSTMAQPGVLGGPPMSWDVCSAGHRPRL